MSGRGQRLNFLIGLKIILNQISLILEFYTPGEPNSGWIHCSWIEGTPRASFLHAFKEDGKTKYKPILGKRKRYVRLDPVS